MTTPHIEENWKITFENEFAGWWDYKTALTERIEEHISDLLTQARQAGIDEAVGVIESNRKEVKILSSGTGKKDGHVDFQAMRYNQALDDTIRALGTKKKDNE